MTTIHIQLDDRTEQDLRSLSLREGTELEITASRLLARAVRSTRTKPQFDVEDLRQSYAKSSEEDAALADSASSERAMLLSSEDAE